MDMDLDDLFDGPKQGPSRSSRFAPKASKFKPKPKNAPSSSSASLSLPAPKKEEVDVKPEHENGAVAMDVELNLGEKKLEVTGEFMETEAAEVEVERGDGDGDGDGDEVVREIDVYFAPSIDPKTQLYLFQYPLRPLWRPYELDERCEEVRVKPASAEVEVDLAIDVDSKNYDAGADPVLQMKKQTLALSWKPPQTNGCTVGILTGNKLHLNPIHAVVQLRPSMRHLDQNISKKNTDVSNNVENEVESGKFQEAKPSGKSKKKTVEQTKDSGEDWVPLKYHSMRSELSSAYLQKMIAREGPQIHFSMSSDEYLNSLCPGTSDHSLSSKVPSRRSLLAKPLKERFRTWLLQGPPILHRFDTLKYLAVDESIEEVLAVLQELAVLVQGLWVPKTSLLSETEGITASARDFVLLLFSKDVIIKNEQISKQSQFLSKAMEGVVRGLATYRPAFKDWKLKELPDMNFVKLYPVVVKKQHEEWENLERDLVPRLPGGRNRHGMMNSKSSTLSKFVVSKGSDKLATGTSVGSTPRNVMSEEVREAIKKALQKLFKSTKTCNYQQISQRVRAMAISENTRSKGFANQAVAAANGIDNFPDELQAIISEVAVNIHGICVPKSSPDHPEYDDLRKVVIDLFLAGGPNAKVRKANITEAAKNLVDMTEVAYKKVVHELCVSQGSAWVLRSAD